MEIQTMGSQGGDTQQSNFESLARKSSLYSLTLNEVQNQLGDLGKPLSSMNLDEFLKNVWTAEANQGIELETQNANAVCEIASDSALKHQTSLTLTRALSNKTVDEVWGDIQHGKKKKNSEEGKVQERKPTLGEMTLEDFLVKAGIVSEASADKKTDPVMGIDPIEASPQSFPQKARLSPQNLNGVYVPARLVPQAFPLNAVPLLDVEYPENPLTISSSLMGSLSDAQTIGQKRVAEGDVIEKTVERRQKRMIKNRESAARSRARKQAYTNELENKVSRLEEENERLKKQKELEKILPSALPPEPKYQLRRTISAPL